MMAAEDIGFVEVPHPDDMDDETFLRHLDKRHSKDTGVEPALHKSVHAREAWVSTYRAFHEHLHKTKEYEDHEHEDDEW